MNYTMNNGTNKMKHSNHLKWNTMIIYPVKFEIDIVSVFSFVRDFGMDNIGYAVRCDNYPQPI